jgi:tetratricopeptide (TPR) repeat protein
VDTRLLYHGGGEIQVFPVFRWGYEFFQEFLRYPGGLAKYVSAFLAQFCLHAWCGALVLTLQAWLIFLCARCFLRAIGAERLRWSCFGLPLLLMVLHGGYTYCFAAVNELLLGLGLACVHARWRSAQAWLRYGAVLFFGSILYATAASALVIFGALATVYELDQRRWRQTLLLVPSLVLAPWIAGRRLFGLSSAEAFAALRPFVWKVDTVSERDLLLVYGLCSFMPLLIVVWMSGLEIKRQFLKRPKSGATLTKASRVPGGKKAMIKRTEATSTRTGSKAPMLESTPGNGRGPLRVVAGTVCVLVAGGTVMYFSLDRGLQAILAVDFYASQAMWPQALEAARANPQNVYVLNTVNRALYHTGDLKDKLPLYQSPAHLLLLDHDVRAHWNKADLYLDLGSVNMALHHLTEALAFYGERPYLLRRLAIANLALGNIETAKVELRSLARTPFHRAWARDYLRRLELDPALSQDAEVARLRRLMPLRDDLVPMPPDLMFKSLLDSHADNRMASEYLLSYLLLAKDLKGLAENLWRLDLAGGANRPALYDEAVLLISKNAPNDAYVMAHPPSPETRQRFQRFSELAKACGRNPLSSHPQIVREFGNSYFFYYFSES